MSHPGWHVTQKLVGNGSIVYEMLSHAKQVCCVIKFLHLQDKRAKQIHDEMFAGQEKKKTG